jgi:dipeptidase
MKNSFVSAVLTIVISFSVIEISQACSNIIVSPGASSDHSSIVAYNADSVTLYGSLYHYQAANHSPDEVRKFYNIS